MIGRSTRTYCWTTIPCVRLPVRGVIIVHKAFTVACASQSVLENVDEAAFVMGKMEGTHQRTTPHALPKVPDAEPRASRLQLFDKRMLPQPTACSTGWTRSTGPSSRGYLRRGIACSRLAQRAAASPSGRQTAWKMLEDATHAPHKEQKAPSQAYDGPTDVPPKQIGMCLCVDAC